MNTNMSFIPSGVIHAGEAVYNGLKKGSIEIGYALNETCELKGMEKIVKAAIAVLSGIPVFFPSFSGKFDLCLKTLNAQKEMIYATLLLESTPKFFKKERIEGTDKTNWVFQVPTKRVRVEDREEKRVNWVEILYGIANPLDTLYFLKKYQVLSFPVACKFASQVGALKLFSYGETAVKFSQVPVLNSLVYRPKDFFVFASSSLAAYESLKSERPWDTVEYLKFVSNVGKMALIPFAETFSTYGLFRTLALIDIATQVSGLVVMWIQDSSNRAKCINQI